MNKEQKAMTAKQIENMRTKTMNTPDKVYATKTYQYWIDASGHLCRARLSDLDTTAMLEQDAVEVLD